MVLSARDLSCTRGGRRLFAGVTFHVEPGGALLVTGPNGAGKSSLLRVIAGLLHGGGTIERPPTCALAAEATALDAQAKLAAALRFWAALDGVPDAPGRVSAALAEMTLTDLADVPVRLLSTGQRRRATLARVIASRAALWLLDEPANGLDVASLALLDAAVARHRAGGGIVAVATHQPLALPGAVTVALA